MNRVFEQAIRVGVPLPATIFHFARLTAQSDFDK
jgi:hypothetical protein